MSKKTSYPGQKLIAGVIHKIINNIPAHKNYYEIFCGTAAVGSQLPATAVKNYNDLNKTVLEQITIPPGHTVNKTTVGALDLLQSLTMAGTETFIFCDPPYLHSTRSNASLYSFEMTDAEHEKFLAAVKLLKCNCMIVHPVCELYELQLQSWRSVQLKIRYHNKTSIEKLYMNYTVPPALQTYKFIGKDCWQRQGFKRKAERFLKKSMPIPFPDPTYITDLTNSL